MPAHLELLVGFEELFVGEEVSKLGEGGVAGVTLEDVGDEEGAEVIEEGCVDLGTADDVDVRVLQFEFGEVSGFMDDIHAFCGPLGITSEDDVLAFGEGAPDGFVGLATHDDGVAAGGALEKLEVLGEVPWKVATPTDDAVRGHRNNAGELKIVHTEMAALMCGCGS